MKKIAVIGSHGTGKTTFSYMLGTYYKHLGKNVEVISEVIRNSPFAYNNETTEETVLWAYHAQIIAELNAVAKKFDTIVCDRAAYDCIAYADFWNIDSEQINQARMGAIEWFKTYDKLYFVIPDIDLKGDGVRSLDINFQLGVNEQYMKFIAKWGLDVTYIQASQIFNKNFNLEEVV
jgi:thymidylate kinase